MGSLWTVRLVVPLGAPLPSGANLREHWAVKAKRAKSHRAFARAALETQGRTWLRHWRTMAANERLTLRVLFTRVAPRSLDTDNLAYAFKAWRDGIAEAIGIDDGSPRWAWEYHQRKGLAAVEVWLEVAADGPVEACAGRGERNDAEVTP